VIASSAQQVVLKRSLFEVAQQVVDVDKVVVVDLEDELGVGAESRRPFEAHHCFEGEIDVGFAEILHRDVSENATLPLNDPILGWIIALSEKENVSDLTGVVFCDVSPSLPDDGP